MKTINHLMFLIVLTTTIILNSCKKDEKPDAKIVGKWLLEKIDHVDFENGKANTYTEAGSPGDFFQFDANGTFSGKMSTSAIETSTWEIVNSKILKVKPTSEIDWAEAGVEIKTLTSNSLVLFERTTEGNNYYESTVYLKK